MATSFKPDKKGKVKGTAKADKITWTTSKDWAKAITVNAGAGNDAIDFRKSKYKNKLFGEAGNDTIYGGISNDSIDGGLGNDVIYGTKGNNTLKGGSGVDKIYAGAGNDTIYAGAGNDIIDLSKGGANTVLLESGNNKIAKGGKGVDKIYAGTGNDTIYAGAGNDIIDLSKGGVNTVFLESGNNKVAKGGKGVDKIYAGTGKDTIYAGAGNDIIDLSKGGNNTVFLESGNNRILNGGKGVDKIYSGTGKDTITGGAGNDIIFADKGINTVNILKGDGHDKIYNVGSSNALLINFDSDIKRVYSYAQGANYIIERHYNDKSVAYTTLQNFDYAAANAKVTLKYNGVAHTLADSHLDGYDPANSEIVTLEPDGSYTGSEAQKTYIVDAEDDARNNVIRTGEGNDIIYAGEGDNDVSIEGGSNKVVTGSGDDTIVIKGTGNNTVEVAGGENNINVNGTENTIKLGNDAEAENTVTVTGKKNTVTAESGNNDITANATLTGGGNDITTAGGDDNITLNGVEGTENHVNMGNGDNVIVINSYGASTLTGGTDRDIINVNHGTNNISTGGGAGDQVIIADGTNTVNMAGTTGGSFVANGGNNTITGSSDKNTTYTLNSGTTDLTLNTSSDMQPGDGYSTLVNGGTNNTVTGSNKADRIHINGGVINTVNTGDSSDYVSVSGGQSNIDLGYANDTISVTVSDENTIYGGRGADSITIAYGSDDNKIYGGEKPTSGDYAYTDTAKNIINVQGTGNEIWAGDQGDDIHVGYHVDTLYSGINTIHGGAGNDNIDASVSDKAEIYGGAGNDTINGGHSGKKLIDGGTGNDTIGAEGDANTIYGGLGQDTINLDDVTGSGKNLVYGGEKPTSGDYAYTDTDKNTISAKNAGYNEIWAGSQGDSITVGYSGSGYNTVHGGVGNDTIDACDAYSIVAEGGDGDDSIFGSQNGNSNIDGGAGIDTIYYYGSNNTIAGGDGDDSITYNDGGEDVYTNVNIRGGKGDDKIYIRRYTAETLVYYAEDTGHDIISAHHYEDEQTDVVDFHDINTDDLYARIDGSNLVISYNKQTDNTFASSVTIENYYRGDGLCSVKTIKTHDNPTGYAINDFVNLRSEIFLNSSIYAGNHSYGGSSFNEKIHASDTISPQSIYGYGGNDTLTGGVLADSLYGGNGADEINGGAGDDYISGGDDDDVIYGGNGADYIYGDDGNDVLYADSADVPTEAIAGNGSHLYGGDGDDTLYGGAGNDTLYGNAGDDEIHARYGNNEIYGGDGSDALYSGSGNDEFNFSATSTEGTDTIYSGGGNDTIYLSPNYSSDWDDKFIRNGNNLVINTYEDTSKIIVNDYFTETPSSVKTISFSGTEKTLSDMHIYQQGSAVSGHAYNDRIAGTAGVDNITDVGATTGENYYDIVTPGAGDDEVTVVENGRVQVNIAKTDGTDTINNAAAATKVIIKYTDSTSDIKSYQKGDDYVIERFYYADEEYHSQRTILAGFNYSEDASKCVIEYSSGSQDALSNIHVASYLPEYASKEFTYAITSEFDAGEDNTARYILGTTGANTIVTGNGANVVQTDSGSDTITAGTGNDTIYAGDGSNDITIAGGSNTVITGDYADTITIHGSGTNTITDSGAFTTINIDGGSNTITLDGGSNITIGGSGTNTITSSSGTQTINVAGANNTITSNGSSADAITADGTESNTVSVKKSGNTVIIGELATGTNTVTITESSGDNNITLNAGTNTVNVTGNDNNINATGGDNTININKYGDSDPRRNDVTIGGGLDNSSSLTIYGNTNSANTVTVDSSGSTTITGGGNENIHLNSGKSNTVNLTSGYDNVTIEGGQNNIINLDNASASISVQTNASTNTINDNNNQNHFGLSAGTTTLNLVNNDDDNYDYVSITGGANTVNGSAFKDYVNISGGTNTLDLKGGADLVSIEGGTNTIDAGAGNDSIYIRVASSTNTIYCGAGADDVSVNAIGSDNYIYLGEKPAEGPYAYTDNASNSVSLGNGTHHIYGGNGIEDVKDVWVWNPELEEYEQIPTAYIKGDEVGMSSATTSADVYFYGGAGDDTVSVQYATTAHIESGAGDDIITTSSGGTTYIDAGAGNDKVTINGGHATEYNTIHGGADNDTIFFGWYTTDNPGAKSYIWGDAGNDSIELDNAGTVASSIEFGAGWGIDTISGSANYKDSRNDTIHFNNIDWENLYANYDVAGDYNNGHSTDKRTLVIGDNSGNKVVLKNFLDSSSSQNLDTSITNVNVTNTDESDTNMTLADFLNSRSIYTLSKQDEETGADFEGLKFSEKITGTNLRDTIYAGGGDDTIYGGEGNDELNGQEGNDAIYGQSGDDYISDTYGLNTLTGGVGNDTINASVGAGGHNTIVFAVGDGTDTVEYASTDATLQFDGITAYNKLHPTCQYNSVTGRYDLVIQYGDNDTDKVIIADYVGTISNRNINIKLAGQPVAELNTLLTGTYHIILPGVEPTVNNDYIYLNDYAIVAGGAGNDTIALVGPKNNNDEYENIQCVGYSFNKDGDGVDTIINSRSYQDSSIRFTGFTEGSLTDDDAVQAFIDNLQCSIADNNLIISYGAGHSHQIIVTGFNEDGSGSSIRQFVFEDTAGNTTTREFYKYLQIRKTVDTETHMFNGTNEMNYIITGTDGNDTINPGTVGHYYTYYWGQNNITPGAGADVIEFTNYQDAEMNYLRSYNVIDMGSDDVPDVLWFKNVTDKEHLALERSGNDLLIETTEMNASKIYVTLKDYFTYLNPTFMQVKIADGEGDNVFNLTDIDKTFVIDSTENEDTLISGSLFKDAIYTSSLKNELVNAGAGNDYISVNNSSINDNADTIHGGAGNDEIIDYNTANAAAELYGDDGDDNIKFYAGKAYGGNGSDIIRASIYGGAHDVTIYGGTSEAGGGSAADEDSLYGSHGNDKIYGSDGNDYIDGSWGDDTIAGNAGNDYIDGNFGDDSIDGGAGNDIIYGGGGDDTVYGGDGDDSLTGDGGADYIDGGDGNDTIYSYQDNVSSTTEGNEATLIGGAGNDTIYSNAYYATITGGTDNDEIHINGTNTDNTYHFSKGDGSDTISFYDRDNAGRGIFVFDDIAFAENDISGVISGTNLVLTYNGGADTITVVDFVSSTSPENWYYDGAQHGLNYVVDKFGEKKYIGEFIKIAPFESATTEDYTIFSDSIVAGSNGKYQGYYGNDTIIGSAGNDTLIGDWNENRDGMIDGGDDYLDGKEGRNYLYGGMGNDTLVGGYDDNVDQLFGGFGANTYVIAPTTATSGNIVYINSDSDADIIDFSNVQSITTYNISGNNLVISCSFAGGKAGNVVLVDWKNKPVDFAVKYDGNDMRLNELMASAGLFATSASFVTGNTETDEYAPIKIGSAGDDTIKGYASEGNLISAGAGDDDITGKNYDDTIYGGDGDDAIFGNSGNDIIYGGDGNDVITGDAGNDLIYGGRGTDGIYGGSGDDTIFAGTSMLKIGEIETTDIFTLDFFEQYETGADAAVTTVNGDSGADKIVAFGCNSRLYGGDGDDTYHVLFGNNSTFISDTDGTNSLVIHSIGDSGEHGYIVMNANQNGTVTNLYVTNYENYTDWLNNGGHFSSGHYGIELDSGVNTVASIKDSYGVDNIVTNTRIETFRSDIATWLADNTEGCADVAAALGNDEYKEDMIAFFNQYNERGAEHCIWQ